MALVAADFYVPPFNYNVAGAQFAIDSAGTIDATGEKIAMMGRVAKTGNIRKVGIFFGTVVKAGGSGLTLSLQDVSTTAGPPMQPDGTQDQTFAIANGNAAFASNTFLLSSALSADRSVTAGDALAVVIEFDGGGRLGADSVDFHATQYLIDMAAGVSLYTASWANTSHGPLVIFEYDDGSYGGFVDSFVPPSTAFGFYSPHYDYNSGSTPDEYGMEFSLPFAGKISGGWINVNAQGATYNYDIVLYSGTTALKTLSIDPNTFNYLYHYEAGILRFKFSSEYQFTANQSLILAVKPTTVNSIRLNYFDVAAAAYFDALPGECGTEMGLTSRTDAGSWAATTSTARPFMGVRVSAIDVGGAGGLLVHPGMRGGFV